MSQQDPKPWSDYYARTDNRPAHDTLLKAADFFEAERCAGGLAVDLGCGAGRDTLELLKRGWRVLAIDQQPEAIQRVLSRAISEQQDRLETHIVSFEQLALPACDLINASYALPFCKPDCFNEVWQHIVASIQPGGRFSGHFFGNRDGWAGNPAMTFQTIEQVYKLMHSFEIEYFFEEDGPGKTAAGAAKYWHVYSVVARKVKRVYQKMPIIQGHIHTKHSELESIL